MHEKRSVASRTVCALLVAWALGAHTSCSSPITAIRGSWAPDDAKYTVNATLEQQSRGYFAVVAQIRNLSDRALVVGTQHFRLESTSPTQFEPMARGPWGRAARIPTTVPPSTMAQCELYYRIRGTEHPFAPIDLVVTLPDGEYRSRFEIHQLEPF